MSDQAKFWDKTAAKYAAMPIRNADAYAATLEQVRGLGQPSNAVLELGCGTGSTTIALAPHFESIVATDLSSEMIKIGCQKADDAKLSNVRFAQTGIADAPSGPFDMILAFNLLHLLQDLDGALNEIAKRLTPGGVFVSKTFCMPEKRNAIWWFIQTGLPLMQLIGKAPYFAKLSKDDLVAAFDKAGFIVTDATKAPGKDPRWTFVARLKS